MTGFAWIPVLCVTLMTASTIVLGIHATRKARMASDFFVAGRSVSVFWNASAISGEYLSAASFLGIAGLLMKNGYDVLWYPVCYATGYLFLLLFIAGPLRRFGAYTIPDFAEGRFDSPMFRKVAVTFVLFIGLFYTMPQMNGAGVTMGDDPGLALLGGDRRRRGGDHVQRRLRRMKGITFVQAFQYWAKLTAISIPIFVIASIYGGYHPTSVVVSRDDDWSSTPNGDATDPESNARIATDSVITIKGVESYPSNALVFSRAGKASLEFPDGAVIDKILAPRLLTTDQLRVPAREGIFPGLAGLVIGDRITIPKGGVLDVTPYVRIPPDRLTLHGPLAPRVEFKEKTRAILKAGSFIPNAPPGRSWLKPFGPMTSKYGHPLLYTYSLIIALVCGTAGLPHILVRFYTNPDGRSAKRTTLWVMVMLGGFYVFPPAWGAIGRVQMPELYASGATDTLVLRLPTILASPLWGQVLSGITSAGAFAAFMSTFSGLLVSMSGALAHDIYGKMLRPRSSSVERLVAFKVSAVLIGVVSMLLGFLVESFDIAMMVGWAFAIAACSYFPLLLLGAWWRPLTKLGAASGMLIGGLLALGAIVTSMLLDRKIVVIEMSPLIRSLLEQPAIWGVPLSMAIMVVVSKLTPGMVPKDVDLKMLRLHAPEELGLSKNYIDN